ncbi:MAG: Ig-like domain-containing protein [Planctomycetota bacterium]|nr:Ig-like domain-containing protein [Planctomycetota bacterium]
MTKREKLLATIVVVTLVVVGGVYLINRIATAFDQRFADQITWNAKIETQSRLTTQGKKAENNLRDWRARSLPEDRELAQALYLDWLGKRADAVGLSSRKVSPADGHFEGKVYYVHRFLLSGQGDLKQLTRLLYDFYSIDHMHRITRLSIKPIATSKQLDISMTVEAISVTGAPEREALDEPPAHRLARPDVEEYVNSIISRNFFAPANQPPQVASSTSQQGNPNKPLTFRLQATDPESEPLSYYLDGDAPEGLEVGQDGQVRWTPSELGEFEFPYRVEDGGLPSKSGRGLVKLTIVEAPVPPPAVTPQLGFDPATQATVSGITESDGQPAIWINVRTEGKVLKLREGDALSVGTIQGKIAKIRVREKEAEIATADGGTLVVALGDSLVEA